MFPHLFKDLCESNLHCDVCELAKHKRVIFPTISIISPNIILSGARPVDEKLHSSWERGRGARRKYRRSSEEESCG